MTFSIAGAPFAGRRVGRTVALLAVALGLGCAREDEETVELVADLGSIEIGDAPPPEPKAPRAERQPRDMARPEPSRAPASARTRPPRPEEMPAQQREIGRAIRERAPQVQRCYERVLKRNDAVGGTLTLAFTIEPDGRTTGLRFVRDGIGSGDLRACVAEAVSSWRFAPTGGDPIDVTYPFRLVPGF